MIRAHIYVTGVVQGVCYRHYTKETAKGLNVKGWVRNCPDGRVEMVAEGDPSSVEKLISWCHKGPTAAKVSNVSVNQQDYEGNFTDFSISYH